MTRPNYFSHCSSKRAKKYREAKKEFNIKRDAVFNIRKLLRDGKKNMAYNCINDYINTYGEDGYIIHELGKYNCIIGNVDEAAILYQKNIDNNSINKYYSMYELAKIERRDRNYNKAIFLLNEIINSNHPEKCHAKLEMAKLYFVLDDYDLAISLLSDLILTNQSNKILAFDCIMEYAQDFKDRKTAIKYFNIIKDDLNDVQLEFYKAIILTIEGHDLKGKEIMENIASYNNEYKYRAKYSLAITYFEMEEYQTAIDLCDEILNSGDVYEINCYKLLINIYTLLKDYNKVDEYINKLKDITENNESILNYFYGNLYGIKREYDTALSYYNKIDNKNKITYRDTLFRKLCIYFKQHKYKEAKILLDEFEQVDFNNKFGNFIKLSYIYIAKELDVDIDVIATTYAEKQLINYSKEEAINHIELHKSEDDTKLIHSIFNKDINISDLYDYAITHINDENYYSNNFMDYYLLDYPNVGYEGDKVINHIKVVTIPNTKKIITIYPFDRLSIQKENSKPKFKHMSRIDKFNQKYGIS